MAQPGSGSTTPSSTAPVAPLSSVLGPADWTHGIARPVQNVVADPNPNLTVQLFRPPSGPWVGVRAETRWRPAAGLGVGSGMLLDVHGEIGRVSMSVILVPFPKVCGRAARKAGTDIRLTGYSLTLACSASVMVRHMDSG